MSRKNSTDEPWYVRSFGGLYSLVYTHRDDATAQEEIGKLFGILAISGRERVLDLCCGAGRHTDAACTLGFDMTGLDLSPELLGEARKRPALRDRLVRGDMRRLPFRDGAARPGVPAGSANRDRSPGFDLVLNLFTSFGYFEEDRENEAALREMARVLRPGGRLVIDHINRSRLEQTLVPANGEVRQGLTLEYRRRIEEDRVIKTTTVTDKNGVAAHFRESVRLFHPEEIGALLERQGFVRVEVVGSFSGVPFDPASERMILIATKPAADEQGAQDETREGDGDLS